MKNLQIKNEEQFLFDELKKHLKSQIAEFEKRVVDYTSYLKYGMETNTFKKLNKETNTFIDDDERRLIWMQTYTIQLRNAEYQLKWYQKQYNNL
jgi:hypothetical protein